MAEFKPNEKQKEFLDANNCNVLVSASAGSGKTSTMIQKLVRIIALEHISITSLLVVTYTNAAASEIKLKLFNELTNLINITDNIKEKTFLQEQLENLNNAEIGTLHAICKK
ncbi:MAG: UvrD-helicase domain-containing protein, partial [Christensenellales bacterium]